MRRFHWLRALRTPRVDARRVSRATARVPLAAMLATALLLPLPRAQQVQGATLDFSVTTKRLKLVLAGSADQDKIEFDGTLTTTNPGTPLDGMNPLEYDITISLSTSDPAGNPYYKTIVPVGGLSETAPNVFTLNAAGQDRTGVEKFTITKSSGTWNVSLRDRHTVVPSVLNYTATCTTITLTKAGDLPRTGEGCNTLINNGVVWTTN